MRGFTIVELVLSIAILGVLGMALGPGIATSVQSYNLAASRRQSTAEARAGMERMVREIRQIPGTAQVISLGASNFQFQFPTGTAITYSLSGTNLLRNSDVLVSNVSGLSFAYYDQTGAATATPSNVRSVQVQFTTTAPYTLRTRVFMPNTGNYYGGFVSQ